METWVSLRMPPPVFVLVISPPIVSKLPQVILLLAVMDFDPVIPDETVMDPLNTALLLTVSVLVVREAPIVALLLTVREFAVRDAETVRLLLATTASLNVWAAVHVLALFRAARVPLVGSVRFVVPERV